MWAATILFRPSSAFMTLGSEVWAPLLRSRSNTKTGLFTRLAERDAAQPVWQQNCDNCDSPECEHALMRQRHSAGE